MGGAGNDYALGAVIHKMEKREREVRMEAGALIVETEPPV